VTEADWRGRRHELQLQQAPVAADDRVLVVDDWAETGNQALAVRHLVEEAGAVYVGLSLIVDQMSNARREQLAPVTSAVTGDDLRLSNE
jgi:adenine phosphoribosyltransferase